MASRQIKKIRGEKNPSFNSRENYRHIAALCIEERQRHWPVTYPPGADELIADYVILALAANPGRKDIALGAMESKVNELEFAR